MLLKAEHSTQFDFELNKLLNEFPNETEIFRIVQDTNFCEFAESIYFHSNIASSPVESINSGIKDL